MAFFPKIEGRHLIAAAVSLFVAFLFSFMLQAINYGIYFDMGSYPLIEPCLLLALATFAIFAKFYRFSKEDIPALGICMFFALLVGYYISDFIVAARPADVGSTAFEYWGLFRIVYSSYFFVNTFSLWDSLGSTIAGLLRIVLTLMQTSLIYSALLFIIFHLSQEIKPK